MIVQLSFSIRSFEMLICLSLEVTYTVRKLDVLLETIKPLLHGGWYITQ